MSRPPRRARQRTTCLLGENCSLGGRIGPGHMVMDYGDGLIHACDKIPGAPPDPDVPAFRRPTERRGISPVAGPMLAEISDLLWGGKARIRATTNPHIVRVEVASDVEGDEAVRMRKFLDERLDDGTYLKVPDGPVAFFVQRADATT